ncbi:S1 RNA-binding domain-containing protein [Micromonospora sp. NPDC049559]|uniref:S1 RNA-binding domain-containing protein n=1 Tax=Micromonospora sp. NPDC049559 TaxID=3155923 RepID=UPI003447BDCC
MSRFDQGVSQPAWDEFVARHGVGDVVDGRVTKVVPFGALVEVADRIPGLVTGAAPAEVGACLPVRIKEFDAEKRRVSLSVL